MSRWLQYDDDEYRLPEGMKRIGYDADTQRYTFQDEEGLWLGEEGAEFGGRLTFLGRPDPSAYLSDDDFEDHETGSNNKFRLTNRSLFPFMLIILVFILYWVWPFKPSFPFTSPSSPSKDSCESAGDGWKNVYVIHKGDTCYDIAQKNGLELDDLLKHNSKVNCDTLQPDRDFLCLPAN